MKQLFVLRRLTCGDGLTDLHHHVSGACMRGVTRFLQQLFDLFGRKLRGIACLPRFFDFRMNNLTAMKLCLRHAR